MWCMLHKFPGSFQHFDAHCRIFLGNPSTFCGQLPDFLGVCGNFSDVAEYARWMLYKFPRKLWRFDGRLTDPRRRQVPAGHKCRGRRRGKRKKRETPRSKANKNPHSTRQSPPAQHPPPPRVCWRKFLDKTCASKAWCVWCF